MRVTRRSLVTSTLVVLSCLAAVYARHAACPGPSDDPDRLPGVGPGSGPRTVEPTLPLVIDLDVAPGTAAHPGTAELRATLEAGEAIESLSLSLVLPDGVIPEGEGDLLRGRATSLRAAERRIYAVRLRTAGEGPHELRLQATFRLADGRTFHTQQGATLRTAPPRRVGTARAGAYEVMGVPLRETGR